MEHTTRFDGKGDIYAKSRPKYANGFLDYMKNTLNIPDGSIFADIGSGTGIFTEQLLSSSYRVYAVEPNADMRKKAENKLSSHPMFTSVIGMDKDTTLPDASVDFVTVAQAFHWFDANAFKKECYRILKPGGRIILIYNSRDENAECTKALASIRSKYNSDFHGFSNGISDEACRAFFEGKCTVYKEDNSPSYDKQAYIDRALSSSYSLCENDPRYNEYLNDIAALFDRFALDGILSVPTYTVAYIGEAIDTL